MPNYQNFDFDKVSYEIIEKNPQHIRLKYDSKPLSIKTPIVGLPFGLETVYNNYILKFSLKDYQTNPDVSGFLNLLLALESHIENFINDKVEKNGKLSSQIIFDKNQKFPPLISSKLIQYKGHVTTKIISIDSQFNTYLDIKSSSNVEAELLIDSVWKFGDKYYCKFKVSSLKYID